MKIDQARNKPTEVNAEELRTDLGIKEMLEKNRDRIKQDAAILAFKVRQAGKSPR